MALGKVIVAPQNTFLILNTLTSALLLTSALAQLSEDFRVVRLLGNFIFWCIYWATYGHAVLRRDPLDTYKHGDSYVASVDSVTVWGQKMKGRVIDIIYHNKLQLVTFEK